jgi:hypothetical protein
MAGKSVLLDVFGHIRVNAHVRKSDKRRAIGARKGCNRFTTLNRCHVDAVELYLPLFDVACYTTVIFDGVRLTTFDRSYGTGTFSTELTLWSPSFMDEEWVRAGRGLG